MGGGGAILKKSKKSKSISGILGWVSTFLESPQILRFLCSNTRKLFV